MSLNGAKVVRYHACERKRRWGRDGAQASAERTGGGVRAYLCPFCQGWHVGHVPSMRTLHRVADALRVLAQQEERVG